MMQVLIGKGATTGTFVEQRCHGFDELASGCPVPPAAAAQMTGVPAEDIVAAARLYADGPSTFVSGHGIDASSAGVQTFRAFHCLVAISGNLNRPGGNLRQRTPPGFSGTISSCCTGRPSGSTRTPNGARSAPGVFRCGRVREAGRPRATTRR